MKRCIAVILVLAVVLSVSVSLAEFPPSEYEQKYIGSWSMYAVSRSGPIYFMVVTFLDNFTVIQRSMKFVDGELAIDNKAIGTWGEFSDSILLTLAGTDMAATINDDGYMVMKFFKTMETCGIYSKCPDMTSALGW